MALALPVLRSSASACDAEGAALELPPRPAAFSEEPDALVDRLGRHITYARLSVTDRCDLACVYCMPPEGEREHERRAGILDFDEIARLAALLSRSGVRRLRLTGGEPTVRRALVELVASIHRRVPALELALTTNGMRLSELAAPLAAAGLRSVNVSIDSLDPDRFAELTRGGSLAKVLAGVRAALDARLAVKVNAVLIGERSLDEAPALVRWAWSLGITPRFIELMPLGEGAKLPAEAFVPGGALWDRLGSLVEDSLPPAASVGPARYRAGKGGRVGLIAATTEPFCETCNRIRVTAKGELRGCLGSPHGVSLRDVMRRTPSDLDLAWALHAALATKAAQHHFADGRVGVHTEVGMSLIGG